MISGPVTTDAQTLLLLRSSDSDEVKIGHVIICQNKTGIESVFAWTVPWDCNLIYVQALNTSQSIITRNAGLTISAANAAPGLSVDQFITVVGSTSVFQAGISWPFKSGENIYVRQVTGANCLFYVEETVPAPTK